MIARHEHITPGPAEALAAEFREHVPALATVRLKLRAVHITDFDAFAEIVCGDRGKHIGGPMSRDDAWYAKHIKTSEQKANIFTKGLPAKQFKAIRKLLIGW